VVKVKTEPLPPVGAAAVHTGCGIISPSLLLRTSLGEAIHIMWIAAEEVYPFSPTHLLPSLMLYYLTPAIIVPIFPAFVEMTTLRPFLRSLTPGVGMWYSGAGNGSSFVFILVRSYRIYI
jgi:hypothetical protein